MATLSVMIFRDFGLIIIVTPSLLFGSQMTTGMSRLVLRWYCS